MKIISRNSFMVPAIVLFAFAASLQSLVALAAEPVKENVIVQPGKGRVVKPSENPWGGGEVQEALTVNISTTLLDKGYKDGLTFVDQGVEHAESLYFSFPEGGHLTSGSIKFNVAPTPYLTAADRLQISINDKVRLVKYFGTEVDKAGQQIEVPFTLSDITNYGGKSTLKVTVAVALKAGENLCPAHVSLCRYVKIAPDSGMVATVDYNKKLEVKSSWALLGNKVKISIPAGQVSQSLFAAAWEVGRLIRRTGRNVEFTRLPEVGDFVILGKDATSENLAGVSLSNIEPGLHARELAGKNAIVISEPFEKSFEEISALDAADLKVFVPIKGKTKEESRYQVRLANMGLDESERQLSGATTKGKWSVGIATNRFPFGFMPEGMEFQVSTIDLKGSDSLMVYVYLNDFLQKSFRLEGEGSAKTLAVHFNELNISKTYNAVRIVAERIDSGTPNGSYPVQISNSSMILKRVIVEVPRRFDELGLYFVEGFDTYLPEAYLQDPIDALQLLTGLADELNFKVGAGSVVFYKPDYVFKPARPFILFGSPKVDFSYQGVHFDRGAYLVEDWGDRHLISEPEAQNLSVIQIVQQGDISGLWLAPGPACKRLPRTETPLRQDNVALIDDAGIVLTFDGMDPKGLKLVYKNFRTWEETLAYYSFTILVVVWVFAVLFFAYVLRLVRRNEKRGEA